MINLDYLRRMRATGDVIALVEAGPEQPSLWIYDGLDDITNPNALGEKLNRNKRYTGYELGLRVGDIVGDRATGQAFAVSASSSKEIQLEIRPDLDGRVREILANAPMASAQAEAAGSTG